MLLTRICIAASLLIVLGSSAIAQKPNVIILLGDDIGYEAFGNTGNEFTPTPNIDKLAKQGLVFDRFYGTVSQCAPIRAELYTGLFPRNNGVLANAVSVKKPNVKSMVDHLKPLGYRVGLTGKSHFSLGSRFKNIKGFPSACNSSVGKYSLDGVKSFITESGEHDQPFCAVIASIHAHHPWDLGEPPATSDVVVPKHYIDTPATRKCIASHSAEVVLFDQQLGDIKQMMDEMDLSDNTILLVLSEQGIAMPRAKWSVYEKGNRSLFIAYWPGKIAPGRTNALGQYCDILPTLVDFAGGAAPKVDGISMRPVLEGESKKHRDCVHLSNVHPTRQWALIQDDWKLVWSPFGEDRHVVDFIENNATKMFNESWNEWIQLAETDPTAAKKVSHVVSPDEFELYRIDTDYNEATNLANDPENQTRIREMLQQLKEMVGDVTKTVKRVEKPKAKAKAKRKKNMR